MWAIGAGMSTASDGPSPCTLAMSVAFQLSPRCVCSTALGIPVDPDVNKTTATSAGCVGGTAGADRRAAQRLGQRGGTRDRVGWHLDDERGVDLRQRALHLGRAEGMEQRGGHGADAPAGPGEDGGGQAVGDLPGDGRAPAHAI